MAEAYGYYTYGDIKDKTLHGQEAVGIEKISGTLYVASKNATAFASPSYRELQYYPSIVISKECICFNPSLNKSANTHLVYTNNSSEEEIQIENLTQNSYKINGNSNGYSEVIAEGQILTHPITVTTIPEETALKINGIETKNYIAYESEEIILEGSYPGYATKTQHFEIWNPENLVFKLSLEKLFKINPIPEDAIVTINGIIANELKVGEGDSITYKVEAPGYATKEETLVIEEDTILDIELDLAEKTVNYPSDTLPSYVTTSGIGTSTSYAFCKSSDVLYSASGSYNVNNGSSYAYIKFTTPDRQTTLSVTCYVSSENNYDFGAIWVGTTSVNPSQSNVKSGTSISGGSYLYRNSGSASSTTSSMTLQPNTTYYINLIYVKDGSGNTGSDRFYISNIQFTCAI